MASFFMLDTAGDQQLCGSNAEQPSAALYNGIFRERQEQSEDDEEEESGEVELFGVKVSCKNVSKVIASSTQQQQQETSMQMPSKVAIQLDEVAERVNEAVQNAGTRIVEKRHRITELHTEIGEDLSVRKANVEVDMEQAKRITGIEKLQALPTVSRRRQPILNRSERSKTKGSGWFDLPATEITREMRNELKIIQMRSVLDPKHFYKKNDLRVLPKYFQVGTVQHSPLDYYSERHTRKTKKSLVDELLADEDFQKFNKRKYKEVIQRTDKSAHRKAMKKMKKLKKKKNK
ncbi:deoxynucleotidyltransferase terminal-interacting protein 2 [Drosophila grimshawi]|uniref:GH13291 n=1 Tax=Drosophila grimshawi TaxID=7222 RepID=B4JQ21_DROGR|nr:deoxynucleotidyltransferase terminal-interacting protein 2 [Drosophila grimshawi]EDV99001.1 GH13291 [Drosophila grimshawi]